MPKTVVVTGAFGYSGKYITQRLLDGGNVVRTLTNSPKRGHSFGDKVAVHPYNFADPEELAAAMQGADVLINTYWVRFNYGEFKHSDAVTNTLKLFEAAKKAGISRIVHISITNPSEDSPLEYFRGKAKLERALRETGISHSILRPAVLFGNEDILVNNIAWALRHLPVFGIFGNGKYRLQPIHVDDLAKLAVEEIDQTGDRLINAIGPETFTYRGLVAEIARITGVWRPVVGVPASFGYLSATLLGKLVGDVIITREEVKGLMSDLLYVDAKPAGTTRLTQWASENASELGRRYSSELARRKNREKEYSAL